jgi:hypothetical protein
LAGLEARLQAADAEADSPVAAGFGMVIGIHTSTARQTEGIVRAAGHTLAADASEIWDEAGGDHAAEGPHGRGESLGILGTAAEGAGAQQLDFKNIVSV